MNTSSVLHQDGETRPWRELGRCQAVVVRAPGALSLVHERLIPPAATDVVVDVRWSGISTGTERLLWEGRMPQFPGMGYPLVPGYESVGRVVHAGAESGYCTGDWVFVPGSSGFSDLRGLFGGAASRVVVAGERVVAVDEGLGPDGTLLALAATARHALAGWPAPELIVGHGALGRLLARLCICLHGVVPLVWEADPRRRDGAQGYEVIDPADDPRRDYQTVCDASGSCDVLAELLLRIQRGGELILAGFYGTQLNVPFVPAFMNEARLRVCAEWQPEDLQAIAGLVRRRRLSLAGLVTHQQPVAAVEAAYQTAFEEPECLKMVLDWET